MYDASTLYRHTYDGYGVAASGLEVVGGTKDSIASKRSPECID